MGLVSPYTEVGGSLLLLMGNGKLEIENRSVVTHGPRVIVFFTSLIFFKSSEKEKGSLVFSFFGCNFYNLIVKSRMLSKL